MPASLSPLLVYGTGLTHQLVPAKSDDRAAVPRPDGLSHLVNWGALLQEVALSEGLAEAWTPHLSSRPTLLWDELVRSRVARLGDAESPERASKSEQVLRLRVANLLTTAVDSVAPQVDPEPLHTLLMMTGAHVVSLNFDTLLVAHEAREHRVLAPKGPDEKIHRIHVHGKTIWYPHGCVLAPRSIRLGLRDYGLQSGQWEHLFRNFKKFERITTGKRDGPLDQECYARLLSALHNQAQTPSDITLMGHLLLAPMIFFGVGLSDNEWGWWWLMNQRARNLARIAPRHRPATVIVRRSDADDSAFLAGKPAGLTPLFVSDWSMGWRALMEWLDRHQ